LRLVGVEMKVNVIARMAVGFIRRVSTQYGASEAATGAMTEEVGGA
jgi:hypothetical protein